jgi:hypothetical protein
MNVNGQVYGDIEKEINSDQNKFSDSLKDAFWKAYYFFVKRKFILNGIEYSCFYHSYNKTWRNERAIELPVARRLISEYDPAKTLEVGNVLPHYFPVSHTVVDKYEKGKGILNTDIADFNSGKKFDLIISISTLEHVGWDEKPREPEKTLKAVEHMKKFLSPAGKLFITIPLGYNTDLENLIRLNKIKFSEVYYMKRIRGEQKSFLSKSPSFNNFWIETSEEEAMKCHYNTLFPHANAILLGTIENK